MGSLSPYSAKIMGSLSTPGPNTGSTYQCAAPYLSTRNKTLYVAHGVPGLIDKRMGVANAAICESLELAVC